MKKILFLLFLVWFYPVFAQDVSKMNEHNFKDYKCDYNIKEDINTENLLSLPEYKGKDGLFCVLNDGVLPTRAYVPLKNGVVDGKLITYFDDPDSTIYILSVWEVKNSVLDGMYKTYYKNGQVEKEGYHKGEDQYGKWTKYYEDGRICFVEYYDKGKWIKLELYKYDDKGKFLEIETYK